MAQVLQAHAVLLSLKNFFVFINTKLHSKSCNLLPILKKKQKEKRQQKFDWSRNKRTLLTQCTQSLISCQELFEAYP